MAFDIIPELTGRGKKVIDYMKAKGYKIRALNIVYLEGIGTDLKTLNSDSLNGWNDVRCIIKNTGEVLMACEAADEPGDYYTYNPLVSAGAFRIAFGQYLEAWQLGYHHKQLALVQCGEIKGYRDGNEDGKRTGDLVVRGSEYGVNQHTTGNDASASAPDTVGRWSAGCSVGRYPETHYNVFMPICKSMGLSKFDSTYIDASDFIKVMG